MNEKLFENFWGINNKYIHKINSCYLNEFNQFEKVSYALKLNLYSNKKNYINMINKEFFKNPFINNSINYLPQFINNIYDEIYNILMNNYEVFKDMPTVPDIACAETINYDGNDILVSIIVTIYKADKIFKNFLSDLINLKTRTTINFELIVIDVSQNDVCYKIWKEIVEKSNIASTFIMTSKKETIQSAWNMGILKSKGKYLNFLGADEAFYLNSIEILSNFLEKNPQIDWVIGNSFAISTDYSQKHTNKLLDFNRSHMVKIDVLLDTSYLTWVGGMYRANLHKVHGYFDDRFSAAGDTEFKNRVLPFIQFAHCNQITGIYKNYPESRKTEGPLAEAENVTAWHLFRTAPGIDYFLSKRDVNKSEVYAFIHRILFHRKSFLSVFSSDTDLLYNFIQCRSVKKFVKFRLLLLIILRIYKWLLNSYMDGGFYLNKFTYPILLPLIKLIILILARFPIKDNFSNLRKILVLNSESRFQIESQLWKSL